MCARAGPPLQRGGIDEEIREEMSLLKNGPGYSAETANQLTN